MAVIREGRVGQQGCNKKNLTRQRATVFSRNQRMQHGELERCRISNTGLPLFSKHRQGNNMANSPPENFHRRCSPRARIRVHVCAWDPSVGAAPPGIACPSQGSAPKTVPNAYECCGTGHVHKTLGSLHFTVSYEVTTVARFKTLRPGKGGMKAWDVPRVLTHCRRTTAPACWAVAAPDLLA